MGEQYAAWQARNKRRKREIELFMLSNSRARETQLRRKINELAKSFAEVMRKHQRDVLEVAAFQRSLRDIDPMYLPTPRQLTLIGLERTNTEVVIPKQGHRRRDRSPTLTTEDLIRKVDAIFEGYWRFGVDSDFGNQSLIIVRDRKERKGSKADNVKTGFRLPRLPNVFKATITVNRADPQSKERERMISGEDPLTLPAVNRGQVSLTKENTVKNHDNFLMEQNEEKPPKIKRDASDNQTFNPISQLSRRDKNQEKLSRTTSIPKLTKERSFLVGKVNDNSSTRKIRRTDSQQSELNSFSSEITREYKMPAITQGLHRRASSESMKDRNGINGGLHRRASSESMKERNKENMKRSSKMKHPAVDNIINTTGNDVYSQTPLPALETATVAE